MTAAITAGALAATAAASAPPGRAAPVARELVLDNGALRAVWSTDGDVLRPRRFVNKLDGTQLSFGDAEAFRLRLAGGAVIRASDLRVQGAAPPPRAGGRKQLALTLAGTAGGVDVQVTWRAWLERGAHYARQELQVTAGGAALPLAAVVMAELPADGVSVAGDVDGSPLVRGGMFFAVEHPMARAAVTGGVAQVTLPRPAPADDAAALVVRAVSGVAAPGQLRRAFARYVEAERAQRHRVFLHYNSWFDVSWAGKKLTEAECVGAVDAVGAQLARRRRVPLDAFVFDDGWDDDTTLWQFHRGNLPRGFTPVAEAAARYGAGLGTWISPWGGYDPAKVRRLEAARQAGFATTAEGLSLADPRYFAGFRETCHAFVRDYHLRYLKLDGLTARDIRQTEALFRLIAELRQQAPHLFVNITVGTWPSVFWLWHGDATWRGGADMGFAGPEGAAAPPTRERWITFRDAETYANVVRRAPLYPLAALMTHGIIDGQHGNGAALDPGGPALAHEVRSYFGSGVGLQELYVTAARLGSADWDLLAEAARWARARASVLADSHWVGGDPAAGAVYGWASYRNGRGVLVLRCPDARPGALEVDIGAAFELPDGAARRFTLRSPWRADAGQPPLVLEAGQPHRFTLQAYEVLVLDARAAAPG